MQTRREFILKISRAASFTVLASTTGYLLFREESKEKCNFEFICNNCKNLNNCNLKKAADFKKASKEYNNINKSQNPELKVQNKYNAKGTESL